MPKRVRTHMSHWMNICVAVRCGYAPAAKGLRGFFREVLIVFESKPCEDDEHEAALQPKVLNPLTPERLNHFIPNAIS